MHISMSGFLMKATFPNSVCGVVEVRVPMQKSVDDMQLSGILSWKGSSDSRLSISPRCLPTRHSTRIVIVCILLYYLH